MKTDSQFWSCNLNEERKEESLISSSQTVRCSDETRSLKGGSWMPESEGTFSKSEKSVSRPAVDSWHFEGDMRKTIGKKIIQNSDKSKVLTFS